MSVSPNLIGYVFLTHLAVLWWVFISIAKPLLKLGSLGLVELNNLTIVQKSCKCNLYASIQQVIIRSCPLPVLLEANPAATSKSDFSTSSRSPTRFMAWLGLAFDCLKERQSSINHHRCGDGDFLSIFGESHAHFTKGVYR